MVLTDSKSSIKGGEFLIKDIDASQIFIPEEFNEEQQMIAQTCVDFCVQKYIRNSMLLIMQKIPT
jgi:hypothetical protein